ncbi:hypothetical protein PV797_04255 [Clostridiaceae bacterium M8S5]|nr:hypothetical protein PV797_04255 [Clostridiaceae bacterium M8S5]
MEDSKRVVKNRITTITTLMATAIGTVLGDLLTIEQQFVVGNYLQSISQILIAINAQEDLLTSRSELETPGVGSVQDDIEVMKQRIEELENIILKLK